MPVQIPGLENLSPAVKYVIAFAIIFILLALFALVLRKLTGGRSALTSDRGRARQPRLGIVDVYDLDRQRQLILLRRDNVEHLLLVGGPNDVVVETNIVRVPGARLPVAAVDPGEPVTEFASARPVVDGTISRPNEPLVAARLGPSETVATGPNGSSGVREPILKPTLVHGAPPMPQPDRPARPVPPPPARPPAERPSPPPDRAANRPAPAAPAPPLRPEPPRAPTPAPTPTPAAEVRVRAPEPLPRPPEPRAPEPRSAEPRSPEPPRTPEPALRPAKPPAPPPESREVPPAAPPPRPPLRPAPPAPAPAQAAAAAPTESVATPKPDPFSIEDIEAEFARLLGRPLDKKE